MCIILMTVICKRYPSRDGILTRDAQVVSIVAYPVSRKRRRDNIVFISIATLFNLREPPRGNIM